MDADQAAELRSAYSADATGQNDDRRRQLGNTPDLFGNTDRDRRGDGLGSHGEHHLFTAAQQPGETGGADDGGKRATEDTGQNRPAVAVDLLPFTVERQGERHHGRTEQEQDHASPLPVRFVGDVEHQQDEYHGGNRYGYRIQKDAAA